jgi:hypothetical protein
VANLRWRTCGSAHAGAEIADRQTDRGRRPIGLAGHMHDPAHALRDQVEAAVKLDMKVNITIEILFADGTPVMESLDKLILNVAKRLLISIRSSSSSNCEAPATASEPVDE